MSSRDRLLKIFPESPRWVEARSLLLKGDCRWEIGPSAHPWALLRGLREPLGAVAGRPPREAIARFFQNRPDDLEIVAPWEETDWSAQALKDWNMELAHLHTLPPRTPLPLPRPEVRLAEAADLEGADLSEASRRHLRRAFEDGPIAVAGPRGAAFSFCCLSAETENLWDVSIETLGPHRRRGWAYHCAVFMIRLMRERGKRPVWGALSSNSASLKLAAKLGFEPVDQVAVFHWTH